MHWQFKERKNVSCGKIFSEAASVYALHLEKWKAQVWPYLIKDYEEKNIFNACKAVLSYKMAPNQTLKFKGEKCTDGKLSKVRITVLVSANMDSSEK